MLLIGLVIAIVVVSRSVIEVNDARQLLASAELNYKRRVVEYEQCVANVKKAGGYGDLLDMVIDGRCPTKPMYEDPTSSFARYEKSSREAAMTLAATVIVFASLPWLASRWTRARVRPPIRA